MINNMVGNKRKIKMEKVFRVSFDTKRCCQFDVRSQTVFSWAKSVCVNNILSVSINQQQHKHTYYSCVSMENSTIRIPDDVCLCERVLVFWIVFICSTYTSDQNGVGSIKTAAQSLIHVDGGFFSLCCLCISYVQRWYVCISMCGVHRIQTIDEV